MTAPERRPDWLRKKTLITGEVAENKARIAGLGLRTICESGRCPNLSDCYRAGNATYIIMGDTCTRDCSFCAVPHGEGSALDPKEGCAIARAMAAMSMRYAVITSVTRDDLPDGGAAHFANVVRDIRAALPASRGKSVSARPEAIQRHAIAPQHRNTATPQRATGSGRGAAGSGRGAAESGQGAAESGQGAGGERQSAGKRFDKGYPWKYNF